MDNLLSFSASPILLNNTPSHQIPSVKLNLNSLALSNTKHNLLKLSQDNLGVISQSSLKIDLDNLLSGLLSSVGNNNGNLVNILVQRWVSSRSSSSGGNRLGRGVVGTLGSGVGSLLNVRDALDVGVDEVSDLP